MDMKQCRRVRCQQVRSDTTAPISTLRLESLQSSGNVWTPHSGQYTDNSLTSQHSHALEEWKPKQFSLAPASILSDRTEAVWPLPRRDSQRAYVAAANAAGKLCTSLSYAISYQHSATQLSHAPVVMATTRERTHLQSITLPSLRNVPLETQAPYSYSLRSPYSKSAVELCPAHWRRPPKKRLRSKLKTLVLKTTYERPQEPKLPPVQKRPAMMRMKDSDDYITARFANPRTGLISPSIGSPSSTPNTPADALERAVGRSPTPAARLRPALSRASEGRKISAGSLNKWRTDVKGWVSDTALAVAFPRATVATAIAGWSSLQPQPVLCDDRFVVHMPSAREPQPYLYPGQTAEEIQTSQHHKQRARRTNEGDYVETQLSGIRQPLETVPAVPVGVQPHRTMHVHAAPPSIVMAKRPGRIHCIDQEPFSVCGAASNTATFAPFSSPRTPARKPNLDDTVLITMPGPYRDTIYELPSALPVRRKPVGPRSDFGGPERSALEDRERQVLGRVDDLSVTDLRTLPHVSLVRPEHASLPRSRNQGQTLETARKCSLGCQREERTGQCLETTREPDSNVDLRPTLFREFADVNSAVQKADVIGSLFGVAGYLLNVIKGVQIPKSRELEALTDANATPQQKVDALKSLITLIGQGLVLLMVVTILWRLGTAVMYIFEALLWPLAVPFKILAWLTGFA